MSTLDLPCLSVRQPWAWLIMHGGKDIENRDWRTKFRGVIGIHAAQGMTAREYDEAAQFSRTVDAGIRIPPPDKLVRGAILGTVTVTDCVRDSTSPWFTGLYGLMLANAEPWREPFRAKGALGIWRCFIEVCR